MNPDKTTILFGPPGCGKTHRLLDEVSNYLAKGILPEEIGFFSFTQQATENAKSRACSQFTLDKGRFQYFRTLHSMAFAMLSLSRESVMQHHHYEEIAERVGVTISKRTSRMDEGLWIGATKGDKIMFLENMARITSLSIPEVIAQSEFGAVDELEVILWQRALLSYKKANALMDYTDMLLEWLDHGTVPKLKVIFIDEAQDLSSVQWQMVRKLAENDCEVWVAGDDDQAIFSWAGADIAALSNLGGHRVVLSQSYRVPRSVYNLGMEIRTLIPDSVPKEYHPRDEEGQTNWRESLDQIDMSKGKWLILVRNNYKISEVELACRTLGLWYDSVFDPPAKCTDPILAWTDLCKGKKVSVSEIKEVARVQGRRIEKLPNKDYTLSELSGLLGPPNPWYEAFTAMPLDKRAYYRAVLAAGEDIRRKNAKGLPEPRIRISTIHGAKGGEEDNVILFTDMSQKTYRKMQEDMGNEARVWYVGISRARQNLYIMSPAEDKYLEMLVR